MPARLDATVLIATYSRAEFLDETLASIQAMRVSPALRWDVIVVDNNSKDATRAVVERHAGGFRVPLRYLFEAHQGRSSALNTGIAAARGEILAFTDDDVLVADGWLDAAVEGLRTPDRTLAYAGGPVRPRWETTPPEWLDLTRGDLWGTIAIQDHGNDPFAYEAMQKVPLGANMAASRALFDAVGGFRPDLGRSAGRLLLGQEVPEWLMRVRAAGYHGAYLPAMEVRHHIPAKRLTPSYFRRWWFGKGVSRASLEELQKQTELGIDLTRTPHILNVPRYMYGSVLRDAAAWLRSRASRRPADAFRHQMMLAYFAGYFWARQRSTTLRRSATHQPA